MNINEPRKGGLFVIPGITKAPSTHRPGSVRSNRVPLLNYFPDYWRNHFVATMAEFAGTTLFLLFAYAGTSVALLANVEESGNVVGAVSNPAQQLYIALCFGFSLAVNAWVFFRISGGLFNPAVTLGMCLVGALPWIRGVFLLVAQILGGITAAAITSAILPGPLMVRTSLGGGTSVVQGLFIEMFLTAELVFTIFMLAAEKHKGTFIAPIGIGLALFIAELMGVYYTGGAVNPARSFGPSVVLHAFHSYHWIYWVGPFLGSLLASGFYKFIKMLEYETANPGQDRADDGEHFNPDLHQDSRVSFAPSDYAMEEGRTMSHDPRNPFNGDGVRQPPSGIATKKENGPSNIGEPIEYGEANRPYSSSPAPPHPNDQFAGLSEGGMHATEYVKADTPFTGSGSTLNTTAPGAGIAGTGTNPATGPSSAPAAKGALKKNRAIASRNETYSNGGSGQSVSANTSSNRATGSGMAFGTGAGPNDEQFYDNR